MALTPGISDLDLHAGLLQASGGEGRGQASLPSAEPKARAVFAAVASLLLMVSLFCALLGGTGIPAGRGRPFVVRGGLDPGVQRPAEVVVVDGDAQPRGVREGVSDKSSGVRLGEGEQRWSWTSSALQWQRTAYHFQPEKNWMNDPNAPLWHKGWYHLFYQYNPDSPVWGNITWGHAVSLDLIHWLHLPLAMVRDHWYDAEGVFTGSATLLADGTITVLYTGSTSDLSQVQCLARPANQSDPLLLEWVKHDANPVLVHPHGIDRKDFRDPSTAWYVEEDSTWRIAVGTKDDSTGDHSGFVLVYSTKDFLSYELLPGKLHAVPGTGMWECIDIYPVSAVEGTTEGLDTSTPAGPGVKHVIKASLDDEKHDYYAIGTYDAKANTWTPDDPENDVGIGLRYDYGKYYAAKTFYDQVKKRRVLWGWTGETDSEKDDCQKGWASVQTIPRTVLLDYKTGGANLVVWPVEEVDSLRKGKSIDFKGVHLAPGSIVPLNVGEASQLDITAEFDVPKSTLDSILEADVSYNCSTSGGASGRGALGPFGILVLTHPALEEQTAVYFYIAKRPDGTPDTFICQDELRSSRANDIVKRVYGSVVPVLEGEKLTLRILVDHSIVESFAQGGRASVTSRIYPTTALHDDASLFLFNNATASSVIATDVKVWQMDSASIKRFPFDQPESIPQ